jgi:hypothetical protein
MPPPRPGEAVDDPVDERQHEQGEREPDQDLLRNQHGVGRRNRDDRGGDERAEQRAQGRGDERRAPERGDPFGQARMMERPLGGDFLAVEAGLEDLVLGRLGLRRLDVRLLAGLGHRVGDDVRNPLLRRAVRDRELLVVTDAAIMVAEYAAGMIDEPEGLFDVALSVPGLRVIFADQAAQRGPDLLVRGGLRYP